MSTGSLNLNGLHNHATRGGWAAQTPGYYTPYSAPSYSGAPELSRGESQMLGTGLLIALGLYVWRKRRRQVCDLPA
jgi:hypothetical protein